MAPKAKAAALAAAKATLATAEAAPAAPAVEAAQAPTTAEAAQAPTTAEATQAPAATAEAAEAPAAEAAEAPAAEAAEAPAAEAETPSVVADILASLEKTWAKETMTLAKFSMSADIETLVKVGHTVTGMPVSVLASLGRVGKGLLVTALEAHPAWDPAARVNLDGQPVSKLDWVLERTCLREMVQAVSLFAGTPLALSHIATSRPAGPAVKAGPDGAVTVEGRRGRYPVLVTVNGVQCASWADAYKTLVGQDVPKGQSAARAFLRAYRDMAARPEVTITAPSGLAPDVAKLAEEAGVTVTT